MTDTALIMALVRELLLLGFRFMEQIGMTPEEKQKFYDSTRAEFYAKVDQPLPEVPE